MASQPLELFLERLQRTVAAHPSQIAVGFLKPGANGGVLDQELTYAALDVHTNRVAALLLRNGVAPGDRVVLVYPPSLDFMLAFLSCLKAGVIAVPVFPPNPLRRDSLHMFAKIVAGCGARVALTNRSYQHTKKLAGIQERLRMGRRATAWPDDLEWILTDRQAMATSTTTTTPLVMPVASDVAFLQYTSGSTSDPKGVIVTHGNLGHNLSIITNDLKAGPDTVVVSWLPQYHDMGLIGSYLGALYSGGKGYYMSPLSFLQRPMLWLEAASKYKATHLQAPNFAFKLTARKFDAAAATGPLDLSCVRHIINAAEPVDEGSLETFYQTFGSFGLPKVIFPTYGLAESTLFVCSGGSQRLSLVKKELEVNGKVVLAGSDSANTRLVGCGYPARQGVNVQIVDPEALTRVEENRVGEIWVHSASVARGYYGLPEESARDFEALIVDGDSSLQFLRTGDLGFLYQDELFICGRLKDLIIVGGRNYYPQDLEATAEASSDLLRPGCSAAFTIDPTSEGGEEVALVMELKEVPSSADVERVCVALAASINAVIKQEHSFSITEIAFLKTRTVPKTSSGKIARSWCRKGFVNGTLSVVYRKSFRSSAATTQPLEIEAGSNAKPAARGPVNPATIRAMSKEELYKRLVSDIANVAALDRSAIQPTSPLSSMMDSLTLSQFKGLLESHYAVSISDDYLFKDSTTPQKLVEVAKLGYADDDDEAGGGSGPSPPAATNNNPPPVGEAPGLAGALGCPPGVRCVIL